MIGLIAVDGGNSKVDLALVGEDGGLLSAVRGPTISHQARGSVPGGVYHWTDLGVASWYDFAVAIQEEALARGLLTRTVPINPIPSSAYPTKARRPMFSVLDTQATRALIEVPARHWRHNLRMMLDELRT